MMGKEEEKKQSTKYINDVSNDAFRFTFDVTDQTPATKVGENHWVFYPSPIQDMKMLS